MHRKKPVRGVERLRKEAGKKLMATLFNRQMYINGTLNNALVSP